MRRITQQHLTLSKRLGDQAELQVLEIAQAAVDQLAAGGARTARQIMLLHEYDSQASTRGIPRDACAIDTTPDDEQVRFYAVPRFRTHNKKAA